MTCDGHTYEDLFCSDHARVMELGHLNRGERMQVTIGSSRLRSTDGTISVRGKRQILLEWGLLNSELLLTMDLYAAGGGHIARLRRNRWTFNDNDRFDFVGDASGFDLVDTKLNQVVLGARVVGQDSVVITQGAFYNCAGHKIEITMEDWSGMTQSGTSTGAVTQSTNAPFAADEVASIGKAMLSLPEDDRFPSVRLAPYEKTDGQ